MISEERRGRQNGSYRRNGAHSVYRDGVCFEKGQRCLYIHTTRLSEDGIYLHGCDRAEGKGVYKHTLWDCEDREVLTFHTRLHRKKAPFEEIEYRTESGRIVFVREGKELGEYLWERWYTEKFSAQVQPFLKKAPLSFMKGQDGALKKRKGKENQ